MIGRAGHIYQSLSAMAYRSSPESLLANETRCLIAVIHIKARRVQIL